MNIELFVMYNAGSFCIIVCFADVAVYLLHNGEAGWFVIFRLFKSILFFC